MMPLAQVPPGARVRVIAIRGGSHLVNRLFQMGLTPGTIVEVIRNDVGPIVISFRGVTMGIGRGVAMRIFVEPA